ncbi:GNAT family N-acetyltransferase [Streptacidiphilus monticola]
MARFGERLTRHGAEPGWEAVVAWDGDEAAAFIYANSLDGAADRWWTRMNDVPGPETTSLPTVAVKELMVRERWRKTGLSDQLHESLLSGRVEEQATLMVNPEAGNGKVMAIYDRWGYRPVSRVQPSPDSPPLVAMVRPVHVPAA